MRISDWSSDVCSSDLVERGLHHCLGVVETALDRDIMDVGGEHGRHLAALDVGDAARRVEHEHVDMLAPRQRVDRRRSGVAAGRADDRERSEEHTSELQSLMRISYAVFCLKKKHRQNKEAQS